MKTMYTLAKIMKKKILAMILIVSMCLSMLPITALAEETVSVEKQEKAQSGTTTELTLDGSEQILYLRQNEDNTLCYQIGLKGTSIKTDSNNYKVGVTGSAMDEIRLKIENNSDQPMDVNLHLVGVTSIGGLSSEGTGTGAVTANLSIEGNCIFKNSNYGSDIDAGSNGVFWRNKDKNNATYKVNLSVGTESAFLLETMNKSFYDPENVTVDMTSGSEVYKMGSIDLKEHIKGKLPTSAIYNSYTIGYFGTVASNGNGTHKTDAGIVTECVAGEPVYEAKGEKHEKKILCKYCTYEMEAPVSESHDKKGKVELNETNQTHKIYCSKCGAVSTEAEPCTESWVYDKENHWKECNTCGRIMSEKTDHTIAIAHDSIKEGTPYKTGIPSCECGYQMRDIPMAPNGKKLIALTTSGNNSEELLVTVNGVKKILGVQKSEENSVYADYLEIDPSAEVTVEVLHENYKGENILSVTDSKNLIAIKELDELKAGTLVYSTVNPHEYADYSALDTQLARIASDQSDYPTVEILKLQQLMNKLPSRYLSKNRQPIVDQAAKDLKKALDDLEKGETAVPTNAKKITLTTEDTLTITSSGYRVNDSSETAWDGAYRLKGEGKSVIVESGIHTVILEGIRLINTSGNPFDIRTGAAVDLVLNQGSQNNFGNESAAKYFSGLHVPYGASLCIRNSQPNNNEGKLVVYGGKYAAGIGSNRFENVGTISIRSGDIQAFSGFSGAGIGGGRKAGCGIIKIYDGKVAGINIAGDGAGIGSGYNGIGGTIEIFGGNINAKGAEYSGGAGIGGASFGAPKKITITDGQIEAWSEFGAGIGGGDDSEQVKSVITITGGKFHVTSIDGAAIGSGKNDKAIPISIKNAIIFANSETVIGGTDNGGTYDKELIKLNNVTIFGNNSTAPKIQPVPVTHSGETVEYRVLDKKDTSDGDLTLLVDGEKVNSYVKGGKVVIAVKKGATIEEIESKPDVNPGGGSFVPNVPVKPEIPDLKPGESITETKPDGTVVKYEEKTNGDTIVTETKTDGSSVSNGWKEDGTTASTATDVNGKTEVKAEISKKAIEEAQKTNKPVELPVSPVKADKNSKAAPEVKITLNNDASKIKVHVPVDQITSGTVAIIIYPDGREEVIRKTIMDESGIDVVVKSNVTVKVVNNAKEFSDTEGHWAEGAIDFVTARKIYGGTGVSTFTPDGSMTRGMLAQVLYNLESNPKAIGTSKFVDVTEDTWCRNAIVWASDHKIVSGYPDGSFGVDNKITREELACMLNRFAGSPKHNGSALNFRDADKVSSYAYDSIVWAVEEGIVAGTDVNILSPQGTATRAQVAVMLMRFVNKYSI